MAEDKHTEGPWYVSKYSISPDRKFEILGNYIDEQYRDSIADVDNEANADLIGAAPALLFALEYLLEEICKRDGEPFEGASDTARAAIKQARGNQ